MFHNTSCNLHACNLYSISQNAACKSLATDWDTLFPFSVITSFFNHNSKKEFWHQKHFDKCRVVILDVVRTVLTLSTISGAVFIL